jgi:hypothetical protein
MTRTIGRIADRLLSVVVPQTSASAGWYSKCVYCSGTYSKLCTQFCYSSGCTPWSCQSCGSC